MTLTPGETAVEQVSKISDERLADIAEIVAAIVKSGDCRIYDAESKVPLGFKFDTLLNALTELQSLRSQPAGVRVKGLEWVEEFGGTWWTAEAYRVETAEGGGFSARAAHPQSKAFRTILHGVPLDEAKAAAEADYRQRILSALEPQQEEAVANWTECCNMSSEGCDCANPKHIHVSFSPAPVQKVQESQTVSVGMVARGVAAFVTESGGFGEADDERIVRLVLTAALEPSHV